MAPVIELTRDALTRYSGRHELDGRAQAARRRLAQLGGNPLSPLPRATGAGTILDTPVHLA
ncbi:MAG: hypothetical protein ABSG43_10980 [Solirubrobacteraceae bacterium]